MPIAPCAAMYAPQASHRLDVSLQHTHDPTAFDIPHLDEAVRPASSEVVSGKRSRLVEAHARGL